MVGLGDARLTWGLHMERYEAFVPDRYVLYIGHPGANR